MILEATLVEIEVVEKNYNPLLGRTEVKAKVSHLRSATPTRMDVRRQLAARLNADLDRTVILKIITPFGVSESNVEAHIYDDKETMLKTEKPYILVRNQIIEKPEKKAKKKKKK